jgi:DNA mismatch repair ATPase MutS
MDNLLDNILNYKNKDNVDRDNVDIENILNGSDSGSDFKSDFMMGDIDIFKLPIEYQEDIKTIDHNIIEDLELRDNYERDISSLYTYVYNPQTYFGKKLINRHSKYYCYNKNFLNDSKKLIKKFKNNVTFDEIDGKNIEFEEIEILLSDIKNNNNFIENYQYINFSWFKNFNNNEQILLYLSLYNLSSPVFSLLTPIISLILPFLIIKFQGHEITLDLYCSYLKHMLGRHVIGQVLNNFKDASLEQKVYIIISLIFYIIQVYQNVISCYKFHKNMKTIHEYLFKFRDYISYSIDSMNNLYKYTKLYKTYNEFNDVLNRNKNTLEAYNNELKNISNYEISIKKIKKIGYLMKCFYQLYDNNDLIIALNYSFGFNGYIDHLTGLKRNIKNKFISYCKFNKKKCEFKDAYFPSLMDKTPIKNSYKLNNHLIITGPNAAGKTTLLKTTLFNSILSQQIGCGFYTKATIKLYDYIHCYINIPDTSGRDSLFQAEARRCKEILDKIIKYKKSNHLCVFDELYSGTNPYEAIGSAYSFLNYLNQHNNVNFLLTTHYIDLCNRLEKNEKIHNYHMEIKIDNKENFEYCYKLIKGTSEIKGATKVLKDLDYPEDIVFEMKNILKTLKL